MYQSVSQLAFFKKKVVLSNYHESMVWQDRFLSIQLVQSTKKFSDF